MRESPKAKPERALIVEARKNYHYPEFPDDIVLAEGVWDRKGEEPVNR